MSAGHVEIEKLSASRRWHRPSSGLAHFRALGLDSERGSIKVGKYADFVLADQDVFDCPVTDIHKTKVVSTWFEGEKVYQNR